VTEQIITSHPKFAWLPGMVFSREFWGDRRAIVTHAWCGYDGLGPDPCLAGHPIGGGESTIARGATCILDIEHPATQGILMSMLMDAVAPDPCLSGMSKWSVAVDAISSVVEPHGQGAGHAIVETLLHVWGEVST